MMQREGEREMIEREMLYCLCTIIRGRQLISRAGRTKVIAGGTHSRRQRRGEIIPNVSISRIKGLSIKRWEMKRIICETEREREGIRGKICRIS